MTAIVGFAASSIVQVSGNIINGITGIFAVTIYTLFSLPSNIKEMLKRGLPYLLGYLIVEWAVNDIVAILTGLFALGLIIYKFYRYQRI